MNESEHLSFILSLLNASSSAFLINAATSYDLQPGYVTIMFGLYSENSALRPEGPVRFNSFIISAAVYPSGLQKTSLASLVAGGTSISSVNVSFLSLASAVNCDGIILSPAATKIALSGRETPSFVKVSLYSGVLQKLPSGVR